MITFAKFLENEQGIILIKREKDSNLSDIMSLTLQAQTKGKSIILHGREFKHAISFKDKEEKYKEWTSETPEGKRTYAESRNQRVSSVLNEKIKHHKIKQQPTEPQVSSVGNETDKYRQLKQHYLRHRYSVSMPIGSRAMAEMVKSVEEPEGAARIALIDLLAKLKKGPVETELHAVDREAHTIFPSESGIEFTASAQQSKFRATAYVLLEEGTTLKLGVDTVEPRPSFPGLSLLRHSKFDRDRLASFVEGNLLSNLMR